MLLACLLYVFFDGLVCFSIANIELTHQKEQIESIQRNVRGPVNDASVKS